MGYRWPANRSGISAVEAIDVTLAQFGLTEQNREYPSYRALQSDKLKA
ncbi:hypothetical protein [Shewanella psychrotolerans]|nr:hypothetical protein [Shewanella psychrotolerans]QYK01125.1 hypothetical protein K0I62_17410 [Shewanella psychrotolerans]